jgi:glutathione S-transferase fosA5
MRELIDRLLGGYESGKISRRDLILGLSAMVAGAPVAAAAQPPSRGITLRGLNHVSLFVSDMARSVKFYQDLFLLQTQSLQQNGTNLSLGLGTEFLGIYQVPNTEPRIDHVCLAVDGFDLETVLATLTEHGVEGRVRMRGETVEVYFNDPDGLSIQLQDFSYCGGGGTLGNDCPRGG